MRVASIIPQHRCKDIYLLCMNVSRCCETQYLAVWSVKVSKEGNGEKANSNWEGIIVQFFDIFVRSQ